ncbi:MAG: hypothetical protein ACTSP3_02630, partial [Candidatus Heimdallarchaeaceae archaeon]
GFIYYTINNNMKTNPWLNVSAWNHVEFSTYPEIKLVDDTFYPDGTHDFHFQTLLTFTDTTIDLGEVIDYYIYVFDEFDCFTIYSNLPTLPPTKIATNYLENSLDVGKLEHFESREALNVYGFWEYPLDDTSLIFSDGYPQTAGDGLTNGYGLDLYDIDNPSDDGLWEPVFDYYYDLEYTPYRISTNDYGDLVGRYTAAIYSYDFDLSNSETYYTLDEAKLLNDSGKSIYDLFGLSIPDSTYWELNPLTGRDSQDVPFGDLGNYLISHPLNSFLMSTNPYSGFYEEGGKPNCVAGEQWDTILVADNGNLSYTGSWPLYDGSYDSNYTNYYDPDDDWVFDDSLPDIELCAKVRIPLSFSKAFPFFKISFNKLHNCVVDVNALNYYAWLGPQYTNWYVDSWGNNIAPRNYEYSLDAVETTLIDNIAAPGEYYSSLNRPEEFWGIELRVYPINKALEYSFSIDFIKLYQIRYKFNGEDIDDATSNKEYLTNYFDYINNFHYQDLSSSNMIIRYFDYSIGNGKVCLSSTIDNNQGDSWWQNEYIFSTSDLYYVEKIDGINTLKSSQFADFTHNLGGEYEYGTSTIVYYPKVKVLPSHITSHLIFPDFPVYDNFYDKSFFYCAQDISLCAKGYDLYFGEGNFSVISSTTMEDWRNEIVYSMSDVERKQFMIENHGLSTNPWFILKLKEGGSLEGFSFNYTLCYVIDDFIHYAQEPSSKWYVTDSIRAIVVVNTTLTDDFIGICPYNGVYYEIIDNSLVLYNYYNSTTFAKIFFNPLLGKNYRLSSWNSYKIDQFIQNDPAVIGYGEQIGYDSQQECPIYANEMPNFLNYHRYYFAEIDYSVLNGDDENLLTELTTSWTREIWQTNFEPNTILNIPVQPFNKPQITYSFIKYDINPQASFDSYLIIQSSLPFQEGYANLTEPYSIYTPSIGITYTKIHSIGEQWIKKHDLIAQDYLFVNNNHDLSRKYYLEHILDRTNKTVYPFTYDKYQSLLPSSYIDSLSIEGRVQPFNTNELPEKFYISEVKIYDINNNVFLIYNSTKPEYNISLTYNTFNFPVTSFLPTEIFAMSKVKITYTSIFSNNTSFWFETRDIKFNFRKEYFPLSKPAFDVYAPQLKSLIWENLRSDVYGPDTYFIFSGQLFDHTGINNAKFFYKRYWTDWDEWYDILSQSYEDAITANEDADWVYLGEINNNNNFAFNGIPSLNPITCHERITRIEIKIIATDNSTNANSIEIIKTYDVLDVEPPSYTELTSYNSTTVYSYNTEFEFKIEVTDWIGTKDVDTEYRSNIIWLEINVTKYGETIPLSEHLIPMYFISGDTYKAIYRYLHTQDDGLYLQPDEFLTYQYHVSDIAGNTNKSQIFTINLIDYVKPYSYSGDVDLCTPHTPDSGHPFDVIIRTRDEFSNPTSVQLEYYIYDQSAETVSFYSSKESMIYDALWNLNTSEGEFRGFKYTIDPSGYEYNDYLVFTFYISDSVGNILTLIDYYTIWIGDTLS